MNRLCCLLLVMLPVTAFAYPIEVEKQYQDVKIDYATHDVYHDTPRCQDSCRLSGFS
ncbi:hypothetical protein BV326_05571 [Pseudomonas syringae pv. actinidiae]|nr:hypothetical protein BV326_05571 [Pseudomonas syringae pv. actinidiae]